MCIVGSFIVMSFCSSCQALATLGGKGSDSIVPCIQLFGLDLYYSVRFFFGLGNGEVEIANVTSVIFSLDLMLLLGAFFFLKPDNLH